MGAVLKPVLGLEQRSASGVEQRSASGVAQRLVPGPEHTGRGAR
ncbi:hypothetical protein ACF081_12670 [Streptomyces longwoodensis]